MYLCRMVIRMNVPARRDTYNEPSNAENMEYSLVVTPETVCVSSTLPSTPFFVVSSDRWYVNVNGGSPISSNLISTWSPIGQTCQPRRHHGIKGRLPSWMFEETILPSPTFADGRECTLYRRSVMAVLHCFCWCAMELMVKSPACC